MKNLLVILAAVSLLFASCKSLNLLDTNWTYIDSDWTYKIQFAEKGLMKTTHPNDVTGDDDTWEQHRKTVKFYFTNKYSCYKGHIYGGDSIIGTGKNSKNSWAFRMYRVKDNP